MLQSNRIGDLIGLEIFWLPLGEMSITFTGLQTDIEFEFKSIGSGNLIKTFQFCLRLSTMHH